MCSILGRIKTPALLGGGEIEQGLPFLTRRGPDSFSVWRSEDSQVELLHTRLAIVDTDPRANQPLEDKENGLVLIFNGEIYNFPQLRTQFADYPFTTSSDTEVILAAYALHGAAGFQLLKGMFSFALVDHFKQRVWLARDAVGKKPLFVARWQGQVCFGSSVQALSQVCGGQRTISELAAASYWKEGFIRPDLSIWEGVRPVKPGEIIELDWHGNEVSLDHHCPEIKKVYSGEPLSDVVETLDDLLEKAVRARLQNNPSPAVLCSGGIDSTVVTMIAARIERQGALVQPLKILTLGAMIPFTNDESYARYAAWKLGKKMTVVRPSVRHLHHSILECLDIQDEPLGMISFFPLWQLVKSVSDHSRILLSGDGGDEFFLGYDSPTRWLRDSSYLSNPSPSAPESYVGSGPDIPTWMSAWGRSMATDHLVGHSFAKVDRASAEQAVEMRCPLLDWDLIGYARSLPYSVLSVDPVLKPLLKRLLPNWPRWFVHRPKLGFTMNLRYLWAATQFQGLREAMVMESVDQFAAHLPATLKKPALEWKTRDIFTHFPMVWKLLAWSRFVARNLPQS